MFEQVKHSAADIAHTRVDPDPDDGKVDVAEAVAQLEGKECTDIETLYDRVDDLLEELFSDPPDRSAQIELAFTYEGYRINVDQTGHVRFMKIGQ
jgi:ribosomal protein L6P/L9E